MKYIKISIILWIAFMVALIFMLPHYGLHGRLPLWFNLTGVLILINMIASFVVDIIHSLFKG